MIRFLLTGIVYTLILSGYCYGQQPYRNNRLTWQNLIDIAELPSGFNRETKIAGFGFNRAIEKPLEWNRDMQQLIDGQAYEWTESIILVKDKPNIVRYVTTFSIEFRRMLTLLTKPASSIPGFDEGLGAKKLPARQLQDGRFIEQYRLDDKLIEVMSYIDRSRLENWVCQITTGAF